MAIAAAAFLGTALMTIPWLAGKMGPHAAGGGALSAFSFEWHAPAYKVSQFFAYTLDNFSRRDAERAAAITFVLLVVGPLILSLLPARGVRDRWSPVLMLGAAGALYVFLPWAISGPISHWYTYPRYATVVLLWLMLIPTPRLRGWAALGLIPGVLAALLMDVKVCEQFASFGQRTRPYLQVIERVPPKASVLAIVNDDADSDPDLKLWPFHQFYAYITAFGHGYSPYMWGTTSIPLINRPENSLPAPGWDGQFSMSAHGDKYDYLLVQGIEHGDPVQGAVAANGSHPSLVIEVDRWRLYRVH
jgi:hypothetical protein